MRGSSRPLDMFTLTLLLFVFNLFFFLFIVFYRWTNTGIHKPSADGSS